MPFLLAAEENPKAPPPPPPPFLKCKSPLDIPTEGMVSRFQQGLGLALTQKALNF